MGSPIRGLGGRLPGGNRRIPRARQDETGRGAGRAPHGGPATGESVDALFEDFQSVIVPGVTHWNHPAFFGYFAVSGSGPGILGELLAAALNVNAMVWKSSPAATELEEVTLGWLRSFVGLPSAFTGTINDTASTSTFLALAAARERNLPEARKDGMAGAPPGRVYTSREAHSSVLKAVHALGLGRRGVHAVVTGPGHAMDPAALAEAINHDETPETGVTHLMDHGLALGRRFRALKLWFVMRYFGQEGLRAILDGHIALARRLAELVDAAAGWERWRPSPFSLVVLRRSPAGVRGRERDAVNMAIMERVNESGTAFLSPTEIDGETWLRFAIGNIHTTARHVVTTWEALREAADEVR